MKSSNWSVGGKSPVLVSEFQKLEWILQWVSTIAPQFSLLSSSSQHTHSTLAFWAPGSHVVMLPDHKCQVLEYQVLKMSTELSTSQADKSLLKRTCAKWSYQKREAKLSKGFLWMACSGALGWVWSLGIRMRSVVPWFLSVGGRSQGSHRMFSMVNGPPKKPVK